MRHYEQQAVEALSQSHRGMHPRDKDHDVRRAQVYALLDISDALEHLLVEMQDRNPSE